MSSAWPCHFVTVSFFIVFHGILLVLGFYVLRVSGIGWEGGNLMDLGES